MTINKDGPTRSSASADKDQERERAKALLEGQHRILQLAVAVNRDRVELEREGE